MTPIISRASICWVTRIVPSSEAILEPTLPANIRHMMEEENSSNMISRVTYPTVQRGMKGLSMFSLICMVITAPMKNDISNTIPIEFTPSCSISLMYWRKTYAYVPDGQNTSHQHNVFPTVLSALIMTRKYLSANVHYFSLFCYICASFTTDYAEWHRIYSQNVIVLL